MKIIFEINERLKEADSKIYESALDELNNIENKEVFLLKDNRTEIKIHREGLLPDLKSVFLIVLGEKLKIKIKGNLSFDRRINSLKFYPIFVDKFHKYNENEKYFYKINLEELGNEKLAFVERGNKNKEIYLKIIDEIDNPKYTPVSASKEWVSFIEPYERYVELKMELLKQDFEFIPNFTNNLQEVIRLWSNHKDFSNYFENENYIAHYLDNKNEFILLDKKKFSNNFDNDFIYKNSFYLDKTSEIISKEQKRTEEREIDRLNAKFKRLQSKISFFTTNNEYTPDNLKVSGRLSNDDVELEVEKAYASTLEEKYEIFAMDHFKGSRILNDITKLKNIYFKEIEDLKSFVNNSSSFIKLSKEPKKYSQSIEKDIQVAFKNIEEESISFANEIIVASNSFEDVDVNEHIQEIKTIYNDFNDELDLLNKEKDIKEENIKTEFKLLLGNANNEKEAEIEKIISEHEDKKEIKKLKKYIESKYSDKNKELKVDEKSRITKLNENLSKKTSTLEKELLNNKKILKLISQIKDAIESLEITLEDFVKLIKQDTIRTIKFEKTINILFDFVDDSEKNVFKNYYMLNTGDMVLIDTIKRTNLSIKKGEEANNDILFKIIGKEKMTTFKDDISNENMSYLPESYQNLNESQKKAVRLSIDPKDPIAVIQGPPGTGKTEVITNIIKYFRKKGKKVILSSQTNVAIENVLDKLTSKTKNENSVIIPWLTTKSKKYYSMKNISNTWYKKFIENIKNYDASIHKEWNEKSNTLKKEEDILLEISMINDVKAYAATTTTSVTLSNRGYTEHLKDASVLIIDEVSKSILPEILRYALYKNVEKVILVGDYKQLNPVYDINESNFESSPEPGLVQRVGKVIQDGIFYNLAKEAKKYGRVSMLDTNYRSVPGVLDAYNVFYKDKNDEKGLTGFRKIEEYSNNYKFNNSEFFESSKSMYFIDVLGSKENKSGNSWMNKGEISVLIESLHDLANSLDDLKDKSIAIIFPYAAQINLFSNEIKKPRNKELQTVFKDLKWDTVDSFQGSEANVVFLSTVITEPRRSFLSNFRRMNVSLSRAQDMLIIVGNSFALKSIEIYGDGVETKKYFSEILNTDNNEYLKVVKRKLQNGEI